MKIFNLPRILTLIHTFLLNNKYNIIGNHSRVYYKSRIINRIKKGVKIGENSMIGRTSYAYHAGMPYTTTILNDGTNSHISIGNNCRINGAYIHAQDYIEVGNNCVMASGVTIIDSNAHEVHSANRTVGRDNPKGIKIGNNVWIGLNVIILKGTIIGHNSVIAAGSVVKGVFSDNTIIQGNPAVSVGSVVIK
ncbi:MAG: acyltransferase [Bacteroidaceae bacterium]|nr:acyltransferase [Bacteroidaceae bacterium]